MEVREASVSPLEADSVLGPTQPDLQGRRPQHGNLHYLHGSRSCVWEALFQAELRTEGLHCGGRRVPPQQSHLPWPPLAELRTSPQASKALGPQMDPLGKLITTVSLQGLSFSCLQRCSGSGFRHSFIQQRSPEGAPHARHTRVSRRHRLAAQKSQCPCCG